MLPDATIDHYAALGVPETAGPDTIRAAWRGAAKAWHPDRVAARVTAAQQAGSTPPDEREVARRFRAARAAWDVLGDGYRRQLYDGLRRDAREATRRQAEAEARWAAWRREEEVREEARRVREIARRRQAEADRARAERDGLDDVADELARLRAQFRRAGVWQGGGTFAGAGTGAAFGGASGGAPGGPSGGPSFNHAPRTPAAPPRDFWDFSMMSSEEEFWYDRAMAALR